MSKDWNIRYVCYARSNGRTVEEQHRVDKEASMCGFIAWNTEMRGKYFAEHPEQSGTRRLNKDVQDAYDAWLVDQVGRTGNEPVTNR
jgi:hypothetical protein